MKHAKRPFKRLGVAHAYYKWSLYFVVSMTFHKTIFRNEISFSVFSLNTMIIFLNIKNWFIFPKWPLNGWKEKTADIYVNVFIYLLIFDEKPMRAYVRLNLNNLQALTFAESFWIHVCSALVLRILCKKPRVSIGYRCLILW